MRNKWVCSPRGTLWITAYKATRIYTEFAVGSGQRGKPSPMASADLLPVLPGGVAHIVVHDYLVTCMNDLRTDGANGLLWDDAIGSRRLAVTLAIPFAFESRIIRPVTR